MMRPGSRGSLLRGKSFGGLAAAAAAQRIDRLRRCAALLTALAIATLLVTSTLVDWHGGHGARALELRGAGAARSAGPGPGARLLAAQVVFRHGARTPLTTAYYRGIKWTCDEAYHGAALDIRDSSTGGPAPPLAPSDTDPPRLAGGCPQGTLTARGYGMAVDLGRSLRQRYIDELGLLPREHVHGTLYAHTTNFRRTRATLQGVLTGLYPGTRPPFPVNATAERSTFFYPSNASCPAVGPIVAALTARADAREAAAPQRTASQVRAALELPADSGGSPQSPLKWVALRDALAALLVESPEERPAGLDDSTWRVVERKATAIETSVYAPGPWNCALPSPRCRELLRLSVGPLLWRILTNLDAAAACGPSPDGGACGAAGGSLVGGDGTHGPPPLPRLWLWSAHDSTLHSVLAALGYEMRQWAPFAAPLTFELWQAAGSSSSGGDNDGDSSSDGSGDSSLWVRILFNGQPLSLPPPAGGVSSSSSSSSSSGSSGSSSDDAAPGRPQRRQQGQAWAAGARGGGRGEDGAVVEGWTRLAALRGRLRPVTATDDEKAKACWGRHR